MKLISFEHRGAPSFGCVTPSGIVDLGPTFAGQARSLKELLGTDLLPRVQHFVEPARSHLPLAQVRLLPVIPDPGKIVCVGLNYHDHVAETGRVPTAHPTVFLRTPDSQAAHGDAIVIPRESSQFDYEGEIAIVIGKSGRRILTARAWEHIGGYACYNDGSARDWQAAATQWTAGKNFPRTGAFGPWLVTADEIQPGESMTLVTRVNGSVVQQATTEQMIHGIPELIAHISTFTPLDVGDVIVTGTPGGVGFKRQPPLLLQSGDVVEVEVDRIGVLRNSLLREAAVTAD